MDAASALDEHDHVIVIDEAAVEEAKKARSHTTAPSIARRRASRQTWPVVFCGFVAVFAAAASIASSPLGERQEIAQSITRVAMLGDALVARIPLGP